METTLGRTIRRAREDNGLKPADLARLIGRSASYVSRLEGGEIKLPPPDVLAKLSVVLGIDEVLMLRQMGYLGSVPDQVLTALTAAPSGLDPRAVRLADLVRAVELTDERVRIVEAVLKAMLDQDAPPRRR